jgi:L-phenylalanine/L-methionine N-acetyltransferase
MSEITIRAMEPDDVTAVYRIDDCPGVRHGTLQMPFQSLAAMRERFAIQQEGTYRLVAEVKGEVVGVAGLHVERSPRRRHVGHIGMGVHDDHQGRGVGRELLRVLLDLADNWLNLHRVELEVYTDNAIGIHLYESNGFVIEGTRSDYAFRDGDYIDVVVMGRIRTSRRQSNVASPIVEAV